MAEQYGFTVKQIDNDKAICLNDKKLTSTMEGTNRLGTYVIGDTLYEDGVPLIKHVEDTAENQSNIIDYGFRGPDGIYGSTELNTLHRVCINITLEDYNILLKGEILPNYKPYDRDEVYNIVANVDTAPTIFYTEEEEGYRFGDILWKEKHNVLYNNVIGVNVIEGHDFDFQANMFKSDRPYITVRYFNPVITNGEKVALKLRVADYYNSLLNRDTLGYRYDDEGNIIDNGIYRLIISTEDGATVEKYVYSGTICIDTPTFNVLTPGNDRETWFSVKCIDSRGVSSIEHFLNVYVRAEEYQENCLDISEDDSILNDYGIVTDIDNPQIGYKNKLGLTDLFASAKAQGYNSIKLPKRDYYLDYHKRLGIIEADSTPIEPSGVNSFRFLHFSDPHTQIDSVNKCKELMENNSDIKFTILTGDYANIQQVTTVNSDMDDALHDFGHELLVLNGNHEGWDTRVNTRQSYLKEIITNNNVVWGDPSADNANETGRYYHVDYTIDENTGAKLRIICVDQYQLNGSTNPINWKPVYSQAETDWFIDKIEELNDNDYLIIALHEPPIAKSTDVGPRRNNNWCSANLKTWAGFVDSGELIPMIMQAYLDKQVLEQRVLNYIDPDGENSDTRGIDVDVDFTDGTPCTFLGYLCGHLHGDMHTYHPKYSKQLIMCVDWANDASINKPYWSDIFNSTAPRRKDGVTINDVTLDFTNKQIHITRIGNGSGVDGYGPANSMSVDGVDYPEVTRDVITFPFKKEQNVITRISPRATVDLGSVNFYYAQVVNGYIDVDTIQSRTLDELLADVDKLYRYDDDTICYIGDDRWYNELTKSERDNRKANYLYLRTFRLNYDIDYYRTHNIDLTKEKKHALPNVAKDRALYFVRNTAIADEVTSGTSMEDYIKDSLVIPDNFTVDMNSSKFIAATMFDVDKGQIVRFYKNVDSHIKNGSFVGLYQRFKNLSLKFHMATAHNVIGESMGVTKILNSRYCSFENIDISGSLGYECCVGSTGFGGEIGLTANTYIDNNGNEISNEDVAMVTTSLKTGLKSTKVVMFGRNGYMGYTRTGLKPEVFAFFYDSTGKFVKMVTSKLYMPIRVPVGATSVRFVGYGHFYPNTADRKKASDWWITYSAGVLGIFQPTLSIGCSVINCKIHDTRTTALTNPQGHQLLYDGNTYERCATNAYLGISAGGLITPLLGDFEDSWQIAKYVTVRNCKAIKNTNPDISASRTLVAYYCEHFDFINNEGITLNQGGGIESGFISGNDFPTWSIKKTRACFHPQVEMTDNITKRLSVETKNYDTVEQSESAVYSDADGNEIDNTNDDGESTQQSDDSVFVDYESLYIDTDYDDCIEPIVAFSNSTFKTHIRYDYYKLRKCKSDVIGVDYIN